MYVKPKPWSAKSKLSELSRERATNAAKRLDWSWFPIWRRLVLGFVLLFSLSAAHFLGFLRSFPDGFQRLVATSFAVEFSGLFLYYVALAILAARLGSYFVMAGLTGPFFIVRRMVAWRSPIRQRRYMRQALVARGSAEWLPWAVFPIILSWLYAEPIFVFKTMLWVLSALTLLLVFRAPHLCLSPSTFRQRMLDVKKPKVRFKVEFAGELVLLVALCFVALAYFLGKSRYDRLAAAQPISLVTSSYSGNAVVLARANRNTLLLEKEHVDGVTHRRFLYLEDGFIASETLPPASSSFKPIARAPN